MRAILTDAATHSAVADRCRVEFLGNVELRGKAAGVEVYAVAGGQKF